MKQHQNLDIQRIVSMDGREIRSPRIKMGDRNSLLLDNVDGLFNGGQCVLQTIQPAIDGGKLVLYFGNVLNLARLFLERICLLK